MSRHSLGSPTRGLLITGTDTGVGKTFVAAGVASSLRRQGRRVGVCKPVMTGVRHLDEGDARILWDAAGRPGQLADVCPHHFAEAAAPPVAAAAEGRDLTFDDLLNAATRWRDRCDVLIVEGVGGLLCPLTAEHTVADLAAALAYAIVVVARRSLGTLNHTLMTLEVARSRGLRVAGLIVNSPEGERGDLAERTALEELRRRIRCPLLMAIPHGTDAGALTEAFDAVDWWNLSAAAPP